MAAGRKPKTTEELKTQGTYRKDRHENRVYIEEALSKSPVDWLSDDEKEVWAKWYAYLQKNDILKETDEVAFGLLCKLFTRTKKLNDQLRNTDDFITNHMSDVGAMVTKKNPMYDIMVDSEKSLLRLLTEFGMTPVSRNKIKTAVELGEDPFEAAMKMA